MLVSIRINVREASVPRFASRSARSQKNTGGMNMSLSQTELVRFHSSQCGSGRFLEYIWLAIST